MKKPASPMPFTPKLAKVIKIYGDLKRAETADGYTVYRQDKLFVKGDGWNRYVRCCPMDNHFIFRDPAFNRVVGRWEFLCSCGFAAGIVGANVYAKQMSPTSGGDGMIAGEMIVCLHLFNYGKHADGST
uniref:Uncharacterized protein n=1 Tax=viral metagenome TaxID=1070528 RepID=A0A6H1ZAI0_9ZZZZ